MLYVKDSHMSIERPLYQALHISQVFLKTFSEPGANNSYLTQFALVTSATSTVFT